MRSFLCFRILRFDIVFALQIFFVCLLPAGGMSYELLLGTDETGSFSHFAGKVICRAIQRADNDLSCQAVPSGSFTDSLTNLQSGSLDLALVNSKMIYDAYHAAGLFRFVSLDYAQLRLLMPVFRTPISLLVNRSSSISTLDDMQGKVVNRGAPFTLEEMVFKEIMKAKGWQESSFRLLQRLPATNSQDLIELNNGSIQALLHIGMHPDRRLESSLANGRTKIVGLLNDSTQRLIDSNSGFYSQKIPSRTYAGQNDAINTISLSSLLITSADTDDETVEQVLSAIYSAKKQLKSAHPAFLEHPVDVKDLNRSYLHPHPAALLYFQVNQSRL